MKTNIFKNNMSYGTLKKKKVTHFPPSLQTWGKMINTIVKIPDFCGKRIYVRIHVGQWGCLAH